MKLLIVFIICFFKIIETSRLGYCPLIRPPTFVLFQGHASQTNGIIDQIGEG